MLEAGSHWIVASNIGCENNFVKVYDSAYSSIDQGTIEVILNVFELHDSHVIEAVGMQKQKSGRECSH